MYDLFAMVEDVEAMRRSSSLHAYACMSSFGGTGRLTHRYNTDTFSQEVACYVVHLYHTQPMKSHTSPVSKSTICSYPTSQDTERANSLIDPENVGTCHIIKLI